MAPPVRSSTFVISSDRGTLRPLVWCLCMYDSTSSHWREEDPPAVWLLVHRQLPRRRCSKCCQRNDPYICTATSSKQVPAAHRLAAEAAASATPSSECPGTLCSSHLQRWSDARHSSPSAAPTGSSTADSKTCVMARKPATAGRLACVGMLARYHGLQLSRTKCTVADRTSQTDVQHCACDIIYLVGKQGQLLQTRHLLLFGSRHFLWREAEPGGSQLLHAD